MSGENAQNRSTAERISTCNALLERITAFDAALERINELVRQRVRSFFDEKGREASQTIFSPSLSRRRSPDHDDILQKLREMEREIQENATNSSYSILMLSVLFVMVQLSFTFQLMSLQSELSLFLSLVDCPDLSRRLPRDFEDCRADAEELFDVIEVVLHLVCRLISTPKKPVTLLEDLTVQVGGEGDALA